jgi:hypothetical protein
MQQIRFKSFYGERRKEREREQRKWRRCQHFSTTTLVGRTNKIDDKK